MEKFVVSIDKAGDHRFVLKAPNGEVILRCVTGYSCKRNALRAIKSVKKCIKKKYFKLKESGTWFSKKWYFTQKAGNGKAIGISESYTTKQSAEHGIEAVHLYAPEAEIVIE